MLNNIQKNQEQMKVFPDDPPPPPKAAPATNSAADKKSLKITLNRLNPEHIEQMGKSVSEFAKNSPESAKKLGVFKDEIDMFSLMKADERTNLKRKPDNDVCPCKYFFFVDFVIFRNRCLNKQDMLTNSNELRLNDSSFGLILQFHNQN